MKLIQVLLEMSKSKSQRGREKKKAAAKKAGNPTQNETRNLTAINAQTSGAGAHDNKSGKFSSKKRQRAEGKRTINQEL